MSLQKNENIISDALSRLISQYEEATNLKAMLSALVKDNQEFENSIWALHEGVGLPNSIGAQLDIVGELLGIPRLGRGDTLYRTRLYAAVIEYTSSGRWEQLVEGFRLLTGSRSTQGEEVFPAGVELTAVGATSLSAIDIAEVSAALKRIKAAGIRINAALIIADPPLVFGGDPDIFGQGFADENNMETTGGFFPLTLEI